MLALKNRRKKAKATANIKILNYLLEHHMSLITIENTPWTRVGPGGIDRKLAGSRQPHLKKTYSI